MGVISPNMWSVRGNENDQLTFKFKLFEENEVNVINSIVSKSHSLNKAEVIMEMEGNALVDPTYRSSETCFLEPFDNKFKSVYQRIEQAVNEINFNEFDFNLTGIETLQYTVYDSNKFEKPQYNWHVDHGMGKTSHNSRTRKLSFSIMMSDPEEFDGGDLQFLVCDTPLNIYLSKGEVVFFPSVLLHRVCEVTSGVRKSLVGWVLGPDWK